MVETPSKLTIDFIDINRIMECIPHRYPFLLIDSLENVVIGESASGIKNVTINEPFFPGHFPSRPIMPGVLIVEAMAQTAAVLVFESVDEPTDNKLIFFMGFDKVRFRKPVVPGDRLRLGVKKLHSRGPVWKFEGYAFVGNEVVSQAEFTAMFKDKEEA